MSVLDFIWQTTLSEAGSASVRGLQKQLADERHRYGYQHWYGSNPAWLTGKSQMSPSEYERLGNRSIHPRPPTAAQWAKLRAWGKGKEKAPLFPKPKGCYGWVWENLKAAYVAADTATVAAATMMAESPIRRFNDINKASRAGDPFWVAKEIQKHKWKILYYAADMSKVQRGEKRHVENDGTYSGHKVTVDDKITNFGPSAAHRDTTGLDRLMKVTFWWATESEQRGAKLEQGVHFFVGLNDKIIELNWHGNPNDQPKLLVTSQVESRLWHTGAIRDQPTSGIVCVPPGTWG